MVARNDDVSQCFLPAGETNPVFADAGYARTSVSLSLMLSFRPSLTVSLLSFDREWDYLIDPDES